MNSALSPQLLRLVQLSSPTLPVGAYAYSDGLETAVRRGWVSDMSEARAWILGRLSEQIAHLDVPIALRLHRAWQGGDSVAVARWSAILLAYRDTRETRMAERQIGRALARLLDDLDVPGAALWRRSDKACFVTLFTLAAVHWQLPAEHTAAAYAWTWVDSQVAAAIKLVPLGQTDGQRILLDAGARIPEVVACGGDLSDDEIGASAPAASLASAAHEIEYSRLFRS